MTRRYQDLGFLLAAGGVSRRYGSGNKLLEKLDGLCVFIHSAKRFAPLCAQFVLAVPDQQKADFTRVLAEAGPELEVAFSSAGATRADTVRNALEFFDASEYIAIHDAARPLADAAILERCYSSARQGDGAIPAKRINDTVKRTSDQQLIIETINRHNLWAIETPQVFELKKLKKAFAVAGDRCEDFTDDASIMENAGFSINIIENPAVNYKLTWPQDLIKLRQHIAMRRD